MPQWTKKQVIDYTLAMQEAMGLGEWRFTFGFGDIGDNAQITIHNPEAKMALIEYNDAMLSASRNDLRRTVSHELMHAAISMYIHLHEETIAALIPGPVGELMKDQAIDREEEICHWFSRHIGPVLPYIAKA